MQENRLFFAVSATTNPYENLALEQYLTESVSQGDRILFLWQNRPTVVIGRNQNCWKECKVDRLRAEGIFLMRRLSGGGAVYHDAGNLCFSFCCGDDVYDVPRQTAAIVRACRAIGIPAEASGRNDITANGKKFSGAAFYTSPKTHSSCHHGTLLLSSDLERLSDLLTVSREKLAGKGISSVRARVMNLSELLPYLDTGTLFMALREAFSEEFGLPVLPLTLPSVGDPAVAEKTAFFSDPGWIYGETAPFTEELSHRFPFGSLTFAFQVKEGVVADCRVESDAMDADLIASLPGLFLGKAYDFSLFAEILRAQKREESDRIADFFSLAAAE